MAPSARTKQCPACWSTIDIAETQCPQCDAPLQQTKRGATFIIVLVVVLAAGAAAWGWLQRPDAADPGPRRAAENTPRGTEVEPERRQPGAHVVTQDDPSEAGVNPATRTSPQITVFADETKRPVVLVALADPDPRGGQLHYCVPASHLPTDQGLVDAQGRVLEFTAITWERGTDLVMLAGAAPDPAPVGFTPRPVRDYRNVGGAEALTVITPAGTRHEVHRTNAGYPMRFDAPAPPESVVVDSTDRLVALGTKRGGQPVQALTPWREWWTGRPLAKLQADLRAQDPRLLLVDARQMLDSETATIESVERALEALTRGQRLARDRATLQAFDRTIRFAHQQRIRLLSETNGVRALQQARASLSVLGSDPDILSDATELAMDYGDPRDALAFYNSLLANSADHAAKIGSRIGGKLTSKATQMLRENRNQEAVQLLADGIASFPKRADARMLYARALAQIGDTDSARFHAGEAARLDRSYASQALALNRSTSHRNGRRVTIPIEKNRGSMFAKGSVSGHALTFVVDTGATFTVIPTATATALNLIKRDSPTVEVTTANGVVKARQVVLESLTIAGKITLRGVTAVVMDLPGTTHGKGLLGLNVLRPLNMRIDDRRSQLILTQPGKRR
jgi:clan AA aspartic protease (TIGR02281 family)